MFVFVYKTF